MQEDNQSSALGPDPFADLDPALENLPQSTSPVVPNVPIGEQPPSNEETASADTEAIENEAALPPWLSDAESETAIVGPEASPIIQDEPTETERSAIPASLPTWLTESVTDEAEAIDAAVAETDCANLDQVETDLIDEATFIPEIDLPAPSPDEASNPKPMDAQPETQSLDDLLHAIDAEMVQVFGSAAPAANPVAFGGIEAEASKQSPNTSAVAQTKVTVAQDQINETTQYLIFSMAGADYAAPAAQVREIGEPTTITPVPNVPDWVLGVTNLRGDILSLVDLPTFLGLAAVQPEAERQMMVTRSQQGLTPMVTGLVVDEVKDIQRLSTTKIKPPRVSIDGQLSPYLTGIYQEAQRLLMVLDFDRLLNTARMRQFDPS